jgi:hypothetical protein
MANEYPPEVVQALANVGQDVIQQLKESAPEHAAKVDEIIQKYNVSFGIDEDAARIRFYVSHETNSSSRRLVVGARCLPRLWALGFAYFKLYNAFADAPAPAEGKIKNVDFVALPELEDARLLLRWAILTELNLTRFGNPLAEFQEYPPDGLPIPFAVAAPGSDAEVAEQLAYMAMSWIFHHELAHIYCEHLTLDYNWVASLERQIGMAKRQRPNKWSTGKEYKRLVERLEHEYMRHVLIEKEADTEAARWMLADVADLDVFKKRALGVLIALSWLAATDPYVGPTNSPAYPPGYDRLFQTLENFVEDPDHDIWAVVAFILVLHLQDAGKWQDKEGGYDNLKEVANWATDIIASLSPYRARN